MSPQRFASHAVLLGLVLFSSRVRAQQVPWLYGEQSKLNLSRLAEAETLICSFDDGNITRWNKGAPKIESERFGDDKTVFHSIDITAGKGKIGGNAGTGDVGVIFSKTGLHMVLVMPNGNVTLTTIYPVEVGNSGEFIAVDSRHRLSPSPFLETGEARVMPQQYNGTCRILSTN